MFETMESRTMFSAGNAVALPEPPAELIASKAIHETASPAHASVVQQGEPARPSGPQPLDTGSLRRF